MTYFARLLQPKYNQFSSLSAPFPLESEFRNSRSLRTPSSSGVQGSSVPGNEPPLHPEAASPLQSRHRRGRGPGSPSLVVRDSERSSLSNGAAGPTPSKMSESDPASACGQLLQPAPTPRAGRGSPGPEMWAVQQGFVGVAEPNPLAGLAELAPGLQIDPSHRDARAEGYRDARAGLGASVPVRLRGPEAASPGCRSRASSLDGQAFTSRPAAADPAAARAVHQALVSIRGRSSLSRCPSSPRTQHQQEHGATLAEAGRQPLQDSQASLGLGLGGGRGGGGPSPGRPPRTPRSPSRARDPTPSTAAADGRPARNGLAGATSAAAAGGAASSSAGALGVQTAGQAERSGAAGPPPASARPGASDLVCVRPSGDGGRGGPVPTLPPARARTAPRPGLWRKGTSGGPRRRAFMWTEAGLSLSVLRPDGPGGSGQSTAMPPARPPPPVACGGGSAPGSAWPLPPAPAGPAPGDAYRSGGGGQDAFSAAAPQASAPPAGRRDGQTARLQPSPRPGK